jgi:hypothetical protein
VAATIEAMEGGPVVLDDGSAAARAEAALAQAKAKASAHVDATAEAARLLYVTGGSGQALTYDQKLTQAEAFLALYPSPPSPAPAPSAWPLLASELGVTAPSLHGVASVIVATAAAWSSAAAEIETLRLGAKRAIEDATTVQEAWTLAAIAWPQP